jgi:predicted dinucleotide-binding enzyme
LGVTAATAAQAVHDVDIVVLAVPEARIRGLPAGLFETVPADVIVVDTGNYYPARDGQIDAIEAGMVESSWVAEQIRRPVIKTFNTIGADRLADGKRLAGELGRIALPVAGDAADAKARAGMLVEAMGFDWVDAGPLSESWRQQPGSPVYCTDRNEDEVRLGLAQADRLLLPGRRDEAMRRKPLLPRDAGPAAWLRLKREIYMA